jgi:hypothetical protein
MIKIIFALSRKESKIRTMKEKIIVLPINNNNFTEKTSENKLDFSILSFVIFDNLFNEGRSKPKFTNIVK